MNLHNDIMNIAEKRPDFSFENTHDRVLYKEGHRDARHAAAELAMQADSRIEELVNSLREAQAHVSELCQTFSVPLPTASFEKYENVLKRLSK